MNEQEQKKMEENKQKMLACNRRMMEGLERILEISEKTLIGVVHPGGYQPGQIGQDYKDLGKAIAEIREICKKDLSGDFPDYGWMAGMMTSDHFDPDRLAKELAAKASEKPVDYPVGGVYRTPEKLAAFCQSQLQREEARRLRKIVWRTYETKCDIAAMGRTRQNGKVYEVRISKRVDSKVQDTYAQCKVNGKTVITCSFTRGAWMLKRILTAGMQALVNYKAKKARDSRRNYKKRDAAKRAAETAELIEKELA